MAAERRFILASGLRNNGERGTPRVRECAFHKLPLSCPNSRGHFVSRDSYHSFIVRKLDEIS